MRASLSQVLGCIVEILRFREGGSVRVGHGNVPDDEDLRGVLASWGKDCRRVS